MILLTNNEGTIGVPTTVKLLAEGRFALDAIEQGIRLIEADPSVRTVGRGGWPNLLCEMELDACMMDGSTLRSGAVGALQGYLHPVSVAREMMRRLPHELLVGQGAAHFAREIGAEPADNLIPEARRAWQAWFDHEVPDAQKQAWPDTELAPLCRHAIDPEVGKPPVKSPPDQVRGLVATRRCFWRRTARAISAPAPAHRVGAGSILAGSATARSSVPDPMPTRATARRLAREPAR